ncbi:DUF6624 domain-containing protein [Sediminicola luteus]|uniref:Lipoprotein n=1 Tax=Sediminicola luteus TaxID=319238 RepID=A0A2A4GCY2_9FLAO|nr:DUF6624 domain-containing protein [Sediminicola luteus]PCE65826.1 hypothetical protein B7P33_00535 [Sediminicola luteus]
MKFYPLLLVLALAACAPKNKQKPEMKTEPVDLVALLDTVWNREQLLLRSRDSLSKIYGFEHALVQEKHELYKKNHAINEKKILALLDASGWPEKAVIKTQGNWTIANVLQHSDLEVRLKYLPLMKQAVLDGQLEARFLVRAQDRIATDRGELQIYGGQMKYYPETKSFNLWPVFEPENIDARRTEIGLDSIAPFLKARFDFEWNLEEQKQRTAEFIKQKESQEKE